MFGHPALPITSERTHFIFMMAGEINYKSNRVQWIVQVSGMVQSHPELQIINIHMHHYKGIRKNTPLELVSAMQSSVFCPIPTGDLPWQHRLYDSIVAGCIPVVVETVSANGCVDHYWHKDDKDIGTEIPVSFTADSCMELTYPFASKINWRDVSIPLHVFESNRTLDFLLGLSKEEIDRRRKNLASMRGTLLYDWSGKTKDAFSMALGEMCEVIGI